MTSLPAGKVLIVDDSRLTRTIIRNALATAGYEIVGEAVNGREGIELTKTLKPDLVTVDITMPEKGGLESLDDMRAAHPGVRVIFVTALGSQKLLQEDVRKAGALAMIAKPFNPLELAQLADRLMGRKIAPLPEPRGLSFPEGNAAPSSSVDGLTTSQINDLMELGNIGAGNAASRLSDLIGRRCLISTPKVDIHDVETVLTVFSDENCLLASQGLRILGDIPAVMVVAIGRDQAAAIAHLMSRGVLGDTADLSAVAFSALKRAGEFLTRAFSQAVNLFLLDRKNQSVPDVDIADSPGDLKSFLKGRGPDGRCLILHCGFSDIERTFEGQLAYILPSESRETVLKRLQSLLTV
jgi:two-component system, chemotaxis family, chemotaxis protein CheY